MAKFDFSININAPRRRSGTNYGAMKVTVGGLLFSPKVLMQKATGKKGVK